MKICCEIADLKVGPIETRCVESAAPIAQSVARLYAVRGARMFLVARNTERLAIVADDLRVRGAAAVDFIAADLADHGRHAEILAAAWSALPGMDVALIAHGVLPDQSQCQLSVADTLHALNINFLSVLSLLTPLANQFEVNQRGTIAVISSVAGDRGRKSNYIYGSAKSGLDAFLQGLRNRLSKLGVHVVTIKNYRALRFKLLGPSLITFLRIFTPYYFPPRSLIHALTSSLQLITPLTAGEKIADLCRPAAASDPQHIT